jgi:hypothetical protein
MHASFSQLPTTKEGVSSNSEENERTKVGLMPMGCTCNQFGKPKPLPASKPTPSPPEIFLIQI